MAYHYTYKITFAEVPNIYFGVRSCGCLPEHDTSYLGSPIRHYRYWLDYTPSKKVLALHSSRAEAEEAEDELIAEQWAIDKSLSLNAKRNKGWNVQGRSLSDSHRQKMSDALSGEKHPNWGKRHSEQTRLKIAESHRGLTHSPEARAKISESLKGRVWTEESRLKLSESKKQQDVPWQGKPSHRARACHTPYGYFANTVLAESGSSCCRALVRSRCNSSEERWADWYWL